MKKIMLVLFLGFSIAGCAQFKNWTAAQADCASDPACMTETKKYAEIGKQVASSFNPVAGAGAGAVITYFALGILGLKKKKKASESSG